MAHEVPMRRDELLERGVDRVEIDIDDQAWMRTSMLVG
jgi:hypothetical protein